MHIVLCIFSTCQSAVICSISMVLRVMFCRQSHFKYLCRTTREALKTLCVTDSSSFMIKVKGIFSLVDKPDSFLMHQWNSPIALGHDGNAQIECRVFVTVVRLMTSFCLIFKCQYLLKLVLYQGTNASDRSQKTTMTSL